MTNKHPEIPIDLAAVAHDDEFLDALVTGSPIAPADRAEGDLGALLFAWRTEVLGTPIPNEPTLEDVEQAIAAEKLTARRGSQMRRLRLISGAAAIAGVAAAGMFVLSEGSQPGDPLWGVKKVVFAEEARQTEATVNTQHNLEDAERALAAGDVERSRKLIDAAQLELAPVNDPETRNRLNAWIERLQETSPATVTATDPTETPAPDTTPTTLPPEITATVPSVDDVPTVMLSPEPTTPTSPSTSPSPSPSPTSRNPTPSSTSTTSSTTTTASGTESEPDRGPTT